MPDDRGMLRPDESASVKDDDFVIESFSNKDAFTPVPEDTTSADAGQVTAPVADVVAEGDETNASAVAEAGALGDEGEQSESRLSKTSTPEAAKGKAKSKVPLDKRTQKLRHEIDTLTYQRREGERQLADLNRRIQDGQATLSRAAPPATETTATEADLPQPTLPKYRDYATDEEYETAVGKYHTDLAAWQTDQVRRLEQRITEGVESRFRGAGHEAAANAAEHRLITTLDKVRGGKADWNDKAVALKDITSSWYDPSKHGDATAPFLSDLARTRLSMGLEDGAELLYWLGSDPDRAQVLADLFPTRPIRDALVQASSVLELLDHFSTDEGQREFEALKQMHPIRVNQAIGALSVRLAGASSGSSAASHPITNAHPSARPPAGTPGARGSGAVPGKKPSFENWMAAEDEKDLAARKRAAGIAG